jgi:hypothetical protein
MQTDVRSNWRKASLGRRDSLPALIDLQGGSIRPNASSVFLPFGCCGDKIVLIRDWTAEFLRGRFGLFSRVEWQAGKYQTAKTLSGFTFDFSDSSDLVYFKLKWYTGES